MAVEVPSDSSRTRNIAIVVAALVVALVVAAGFVWATISAEADCRTPSRPRSSLHTRRPRSPRPSAPVATSTATRRSSRPQTAPAADAGGARLRPRIEQDRLHARRTHLRRQRGRLGRQSPVAPSRRRLLALTRRHDARRRVRAIVAADRRRRARGVRHGERRDEPGGQRGLHRRRLDGLLTATWLVYTSGAETTSIKRAEIDRRDGADARPSPAPAARVSRRASSSPTGPRCSPVPAIR